VRRVDLHVFRSGARPVATAELVRVARAAVARAHLGVDLAERALLSAAELEGQYEDASVPPPSGLVTLVDRLADGAVGGELGPVLWPGGIGEGLPAVVRAPTPEGFAFHGVAPGPFAALATTLADGAGPRAAVLGLRTIGLPLAAVAAAALRRRGVLATRASARPTGHPYDRVLEPGPALAAWITAERDGGSTFLVVDEGPGLSGSTFLAAGEALVRAGVAPGRVRLLGTRAPPAHELVARDAQRRFDAFAPIAVAPPPPLPADGAVDASGGRWRDLLGVDPARWPAAWAARERPKWLTGEGDALLVFEGLARFGDAPIGRAEALADAEFGPACEAIGRGYARYSRVPGRPLGARDVDDALVDRVGRYCAMRARAFPVDGADVSELEAAVAHDARALLGRGLEVRLPVERPVIADARMALHEWIGGAGAPPRKTDATSHGDDALLPGPVDAAWDVAGAIAELGLDGAARRAFVARYEREAGDRVARRLRPYLLAYLVLEAARADMAAASACDDERARSELARDRQLARLARELAG
jgi:hypothetical protein